MEEGRSPGTARSHQRHIEFNRLGLQVQMHMYMRNWFISNPINTSTYQLHSVHTAIIECSAPELTAYTSRQLPVCEWLEVAYESIKKGHVQVIAEASVCRATAQSLAAGGREWRSGWRRRWQRRRAQALFKHVDDMLNSLGWAYK